MMPSVLSNGHRGTQFVDVALLRVLLAIDAALIAAHIVLGYMLPKIPSALNISVDHSLPEFFNYAKLAAVSLLLILAFRANRIPLLLSFAAAFGLMLADDSLMLHERFGVLVAQMFNFTRFMDLRPQDIGELVVWAIMGLLLLPIFAYGALKTVREDRVIGYRLMFCVLLLAVFSVLIDMIHGVVPRQPYSAQLFDLLEDGGEMIVLSIIAAHVIVVYRDLSAR